jgi:hypothetical protein
MVNINLLESFFVSNSFRPLEYGFTPYRLHSELLAAPNFYSPAEAPARNRIGART